MLNSLFSSFTSIELVKQVLIPTSLQGFLWKSMGMCNDAKTQVNKCLRAQRLERTRLNREAAKIKREHIKEKWAEIDSNS
jgi:COX assembly protein 2